MTASADSPLIEPLTIGSRTAPSRVVFGQHETNLGRQGEPRTLSDRHVAYYRRRAAGGAGVIVVEEASVHESDWPYERSPLASRCSEGWSQIAAVCDPYDTLVLAALGHAGGQGTSHWSQRELWAPSRVPEVNSREVPKWMEPDDIAAVVDGFVHATKAAIDAGCAGVEINAGQYSLLRQFLSGLTNHREDEWGQDRSRLLADVLAAVRAAAGDAIVALRLSCDELAPWAGITPEQAPELAAGLVAGSDTERSAVDLLTVVRGSIFSVAATRPDGHTPPGFNLELCRSVRDAVDVATSGTVKVVAQGSIVDVAMAEHVIVDGIADAVEMTRAQISDADLVAKVRRCDAARVRPETLSNQRSQVRDNRNPIVTSLGDPSAGFETVDPPVDGHAPHPVDVTVVGGGPAGLEAARVAASRGHSVTLLDSGDRPGGMVRTAANGPGWDRLALLVDWLESECRHLGVTFRTATATADDLAGGTDRHVLLATGSRPGEREYRTTGAATVLEAADVLDDPSIVPEGVVAIWDPIGGPIGVGVAELLAARGLVVHLITQDNIVGNELSRSGDLAPANARLQQVGVELHRRSILRAVKKGQVVVEDRFTGTQVELSADALVHAGHRLPESSLWEQLSGHDRLHVQRVGDAVAPRSIHDAILEGRRAAIALG